MGGVFLDAKPENKRNKNKKMSNPFRKNPSNCPEAIHKREGGCQRMSQQKPRRTKRTRTVLPSHARHQSGGGDVTRQGLQGSKKGL